MEKEVLNIPAPNRNSNLRAIAPNLFFRVRSILELKLFNSRNKTPELKLPSLKSLSSDRRELKLLVLRD